MSVTDEANHTNRLIQATSPYLLQHAHNPIDWYEWGEEAFEKAVREDKPIFLSIGYSACHWCHVMAHETFEDEAVAAVLNERFVCIKVDREERPDVDEIYMHVTQLMNDGQGGWPMSVFLMPDRRPIYAGTYFPRENFLRLCEEIDNVWSRRRDELVAQGGRVQEVLDRWAAGGSVDQNVIGLEAVDRSAGLLARYIDRDRGGFRTDGNKFPPSMAMELMLRVHRRTGDAELLEAVEVTLDHMARGGIYDHLGGGICRYSTDPDWLVPHFEKMLYDQALVSSIYLDAYQVTGDIRYANVARDIFRYVLSDLQSPSGGFYSTRDADSEGLEGAYYIWTVEQVRAELGESDADLFCKFFDVTESGNWYESRGHAPAGPKNILHIAKPIEAFAAVHDVPVDELKSKIATWKQKLLDVRSKRVPPGLDDKILAGWNGLMVASLAKGAAVLDEPAFAKAAERAAGFVLDQMRRDGRLLRTHRNGKSRLTAYLSDYAFMIDGLLNLYEATFNQKWLDEAEVLCNQVTAHYRDAEGGAFYFTAADAEKLIARTKSPRDGAIPSGNSVHATNLLRLSKLLGKKEYREMAAGIFRAFRSNVESSPSQFERLLCAADMHHDRTREIAVVGPIDADATRALLRAVQAAYLPNKVVAWGDPEGALAGPLLAGKKLIDGKPAAYVCEDYRCGRPVTDVAGLREQLGFK